MPQATPWTEKQEYYEYERTGWFPRVVPTIDRGLQEELARIGGMHPCGKPRSRFNWGGVVTVRTAPDELACVIDGNRDALSKAEGMLLPKYFYSRAVDLSGVMYLDDDRKECRVDKMADVPAGKIGTQEFVYIDYGQLRWQVEAYMTAEELVDAGEYPEDQVPPEGEYYSRQCLETKEGRYFEMNEDNGRYVLEQIRALQHAITNSTTLEMLKKHQERRAKQKADTAAQKVRDDYKVVSDIFDRHESAFKRAPVIFT